MFPKKPIPFHSGLEKELGKNSNKVCFEASLKGIYNAEKVIIPLTDKQKNQLVALKRMLLERKV